MDNFLKAFPVMGLLMRKGPMIRRHQGVNPINGTAFAGSISHF